MSRCSTSRRRILLAATAAGAGWGHVPRAAAQSGSSGALPSFTPYDFGAKGDGVADDTDACNAAAARAQEAGGELLVPEGRFAIRQYIVVRNGVRRVTGRGGVIVCRNPKFEAGVLLAGRRSGQPENVTGCRVEGLLIDCNHGRSATTNGIYGQNISHCHILNNQVFNLAKGCGILLATFADGKASTTGNLIQGNRIDADSNDSPECSAIEVTADLQFDFPVRATADAWKVTFKAANAAYPVIENSILDNHTNGGYRGLTLSAAQRCTVRGNRFARNVRNISVQNTCLDNVVENNECIDSLSSGIHVAYGSNRNRIVGNRVRTSRAGGEGLLQAYVGSTDNLFEGNVVEAVAPAAPKYHIYCAVHSDGNRFVRNELSGPCGRAYVAVESAFNPASKDPTHRNYRLDSDSGHFATRGMTGILIEGNRIRAASPVPALYLAQISDDRGAYPLRNCAILDNVVEREASGMSLKLVEDTAGQLGDLVMKRNRFPAQPDRSQVLSPRGTAHFSVLSDNAGLRL